MGKDKNVIILEYLDDRLLQELLYKTSNEEITFLLYIVVRNCRVSIDYESRMNTLATKAALRLFHMGAYGVCTSVPLYFVLNFVYLCDHVLKVILRL